MPLIPDYIKKLKPYVAGRTIDEIKKEFGLEKVYKLASNENPLGPSAHAIKAIENCLHDLHRYQDVGAIELRTEIAKIYDVKVSNVLVGNGSEGIMANVLRCFLADDDEMLSSEGTFIGFQVMARGSGKKFIEVPMKSGYKFDLDAIASKITLKTKLIYLCNPNNPTGTIFTTEEFDLFIEKVPQNVIVILDEAYFEFAEDYSEYPNSMIYRYDNVITLRTFSKVYGIASVRIGYGFAHSELVENIMKVKLPFEPSLPAQVAAVASLKDSDFLKHSLDVNRKGYRYVTGELSKLNLNWIKSYANFVMLDLGNEEKVNDINDKLLRSGIIVRPLKAFGLPHCLRISIGLEEENRAMISSLTNIIKEK
ncbi:histidinol-phosphate transaminase [soil metagenome]